MTSIMRAAGHQERGGSEARGKLGAGKGADPELGKGDVCRIVGFRRPSNFSAVFNTFLILSPPSPLPLLTALCDDRDDLINDGLGTILHCARCCLR